MDTRTAEFDARAFLDSAGQSKAIIDYARAEVIFASGDPCDSVLYVQHGGVQLSVFSSSGSEAIVDMLGPGAFFGEECLTGQTVRIESARAITASRVLVIEKKTMARVLHRHHALSDLFIGHMLSRNIRIEQNLIAQLVNDN
jgi:CRP/FNR family cyclic AMP-dependent transcriptional regulator